MDKENIKCHICSHDLDPHILIATRFVKILPNPKVPVPFANVPFSGISTCPDCDCYMTWETQFPEGVEYQVIEDSN
jgi:hypothetical protein